LCADARLQISLCRVLSSTILVFERVAGSDFSVHSEGDGDEDGDEDGDNDGDEDGDDSVLCPVSITQDLRGEDFDLFIGSSARWSNELKRLVDEVREESNKEAAFGSSADARNSRWTCSRSQLSPVFSSNALFGSFSSQNAIFHAHRFVDICYSPACLKGQ